MDNSRELVVDVGFKPFMPNGISHCDQLDQSIAVLRVVGWYFLILLTKLCLNLFTLSKVIESSNMCRRYALAKIVWV